MVTIFLVSWTLFLCDCKTQESLRGRCAMRARVAPSSFWYDVMSSVPLASLTQSGWAEPRSDSTMLPSSLLVLPYEFKYAWSRILNLAIIFKYLSIGKKSYWKFTFPLPSGVVNSFRLPSCIYWFSWNVWFSHFNTALGRVGKVLIAMALNFEWEKKDSFIQIALSCLRPLPVGSYLLTYLPVP